MLWRSKSNKNRTAHGGGEPVAGSTPQADPQDTSGASDLEAAGVMSQSQRSVKVAQTIQEAENVPSAVPAKEMLQEANRPTREEMLAQMAQSAEGQEMLRKIQGLRSTMDSLRSAQEDHRAGQPQQSQQSKPPQGPAASTPGASAGAPNSGAAGAPQPGARIRSAEDAQIRAAEQAVLKGVQEEAAEQRRQAEEARQRQL